MVSGIYSLPTPSHWGILADGKVIDLYSAKIDLDIMQYPISSMGRREYVGVDSNASLELTFSRPKHQEHHDLLCLPETRLRVWWIDFTIYSWAEEDHGVVTFRATGTVRPPAPPAEYVGDPALAVADEYDEDDYDWSDSDPTL